MANGKCYVHGGATPRKDRWHVPQSGPTPEKTERKIADRIRAAKRRAKKIATMTPEERSAFHAWQRAHRPGSAAARSAAREQRRQAAEARQWFAQAAQSPESQELAGLRETAALARAHLAEMIATRQPDPGADDDNNLGAFA